MNVEHNIVRRRKSHQRGSRRGARQCGPEHGEKFSRFLSPVGELVVSIPAPCCHHPKHQDPAFVEQLPMSARILLTHLFGHVSEVELDWPATTCLQVYEHQALLRPEHVAWVRLAVQQLLWGVAQALMISTHTGGHSI
jgi:hypothetical protein